MNEKNFELLFYFDTKESRILGNEFIQAINVTTTALDDLNKHILNGSFAFKIFVLPPENGSFKGILKIILISGMLASTITSIVGDFSNGFLTGLLGKSIEEYGEDFGKFAKEYILKILKMTKGELDNLLTEDINIDKTIKSKSDFYSLLLQDEEIHAIKYNIDDDLIPRERFFYYVSEDIVRDFDSLFGYRELQIYRPILGENQRGKWQFIDNITNEKFSAVISDLYFLNLILNGNLPLKEHAEPDVIECKIEIERKRVNGEIVERNRKIDIVYSYNQKELRPKPSDFVLNILLNKNTNATYRYSLLNIK